MEKVGRNDPCSCGSGKKFKKCCERRTLGGRVFASKIEEKNPVLLATTSFFHQVFAERSVHIQIPEENKKPL